MGTIITSGNNREKIAAMKVVQTQAEMSIKLGQQPTKHLHLHRHQKPDEIKEADAIEPTSPVLKLVDGLLR